MGIGHDLLTGAIEGGPLASGLAMAKMAKMDDGDFEPEFPLEWALKDVDLTIAEAGSPPLPVLAAISRQWHVAVDQGLGREDIERGSEGTGAAEPGSVEACPCRPEPHRSRGPPEPGPIPNPSVAGRVAARRGAGP